MKANALAIIGGVVIVLLLAVFMIGGWFIRIYNGLVNLDVTVEQKWGSVQTAYQRRADLIPNLVETVKGAKNFEKETLTEIAKMRSQAGQLNQIITNAKNPEQLQEANTQMNSILSRLLVVVEKYPDLKSNENFRELQSQLEGTENRIKWERDEYNNAVKDYKTKIRVFPSNIIAGMTGFDVHKWEMFTAQEGSENAPKVNFG